KGDAYVGLRSVRRAVRGQADATCCWRVGVGTTLVVLQHVQDHGVLASQTRRGGVLVAVTVEHGRVRLVERLVTQGVGGVVVYQFTAGLGVLADVVLLQNHQTAVGRIVVPHHLKTVLRNRESDPLAATGGGIQPHGTVDGL